MKFYNINKNLFGKVFFIISILMLCYLLITPLNHLIVHIDEYFSLMLCNVPLSDMINIMNHDVHPPFYYLMTKMIINLLTPFGFNPIFIGKIVTIMPYPIILIFSFTKIKKEYGWFAAGLFSLSMILMSEFFRHYLTIRMYSWGMLFLILAFIYFKDVITKFDKKSWALFTIFSVLGAYTHYFTVISSFCLYLLLLLYIFVLHKDKLKSWALSVVFAIILYAPLFPSLIQQLGKASSSSSYPPITLKTIVVSFSYFAYSSELILSFLAIFVAITIIYFYRKESDNVSDTEYFVILAGILTYLATIIILLGVSILIKPIFMPRYLMPVASVFWLTFSILISKINNKKYFLISFVLILFLLSIGAGNVITESETIYNETSIPQNEFINQITNDNNSIVILTNHNTIISFLPYSSQWNVCCVYADAIWGEDINRLHQIYDFKDIYAYDLSNFIRNNSDKNIYVISWGNPNLDKDIPIYSITYDRGMNFSKVFSHGSNINIGFSGSSEVKMPDGLNVSHVGKNYVTLYDSNCSYTIHEHKNKTLESTINDYYQQHKKDEVIRNSTIIDGVNVTGLTLIANGKFVHTNYFFVKNNTLYQIYPYKSENMEQDIFEQIVNSIN